MDYKLAKKLKDAGFSQTTLKGYYLAPDSTTEWEAPATKDDVYVPTLEELIEACGETVWFEIVLYAGTWKASTRDHNGEMKTGEGATPTEAVSRLWLALNPALKENT